MDVGSSSIAHDIECPPFSSQKPGNSYSVIDIFHNNHPGDNHFDITDPVLENGYRSEHFMDPRNHSRDVSCIALSIYCYVAGICRGSNSQTITCSCWEFTLLCDYLCCRRDWGIRFWPFDVACQWAAFLLEMVTRICSRLGWWYWAHGFGYTYDPVPRSSIRKEKYSFDLELISEPILTLFIRSSYRSSRWVIRRRNLWRNSSLALIDFVKPE